MTNLEKINVLTIHGIENIIFADQLYALETGMVYDKPYTEWKNTTNWTKKELYEWLGY